MYHGFKRTIVILLLILPAILFSASLAEKYPVYTYVFSEFDVDEDFIYNEDFEQFVKTHEKSIKHLYKGSMKRGETLSSMLKDHLMDKGLSDLFIYLSIVESGLSANAVSSKKAVGLWQFMPATAQHYKLDVCNSFDERCDPIRATDAAVKYLKKLHAQFGKWYLAAIAYNCGEGRLQKAIKKARSDELGILTDENDKFLPPETRNYIRKILLTALIGEGETMDFSAGGASDEDAPMQVKVPGGCNLKKLANILGMKLPALLRMNRQFKKGIIPRVKKHYTLTIPGDKVIPFYLKYDINHDEIPKTFKPHLVSHVVKMGDTLESIASEYHASVEEIKEANNLEDDFLVLDSILLVPVTQKTFKKILRKL